MNKTIENSVKSFVDSVNNLFADVESWISNLQQKKGIQLKSRREEIRITEEGSGTYVVQKLIIEDSKGKKIADLIPIGASVIGARGRIDLNGTYDKAVLVDLEKGGPSLTTTIKVGNEEKTSTTSFYKNIEESGWHWIEDKRRGKAHHIDSKLFFELLEEVSDYEFE